MYWFIDTIVTTTFCHEFVMNISAKISCNPIFPKDEVEQQQLMYFKNKVFTITDTGWQPPQCIDIAPKKMMVWQKELIVLALQGNEGSLKFQSLKICRSISCYLVKHNLVMAPKASLTYLPTTQAWRPLASFRPVSRYWRSRTTTTYVF
jgi:hypothetical protein